MSLSVNPIGGTRWFFKRRSRSPCKIQVLNVPSSPHSHGRPIGDFRKTWAKALEKAGLPTAKGAKKLFHDFRRTAARDMVRAGVPQSVAMSITGHRTVSMFLRYNITDGKDQREALQRTADMRRQRREAAAENAAKVVPLRSGARS